MQMDGGSPHWASAVCVHAACKCMKHEAGPTYLYTRTGKLNMQAEHAAVYRGMDFC